MPAQHLRVDRGSAWLSASRDGDSGPPVLFIQGVGVAGQGWRPQIEALRPSCRCLSFDHRGTGQSPRGREPITFEMLVGDALAVLDHAGWGAAHVVGHSMGGLVALGLALDHPARVASLSLLQTFGTGAVPTRFDPAILWAGTRSVLGTRRSRRHAFLEMVAAPGERLGSNLDALAATVSDAFGADIADRPAVALEQLSAIKKVDLLPRLASLAPIPAWVLSAEHDILAPPSAGRAIVEALPGARYELLTGCAHGAPITRAGDVNRLLLSFLAGLESEAPGAPAPVEPVEASPAPGALHAPLRP